MYLEKHIKYRFKHNNRCRSSTKTGEITKEEDRKMDVVTTEKREKETATSETEPTTETVGIQAMQTETLAADNNSDHGGIISPPDNSYTPK